MKILEIKEEYEALNKLIEEQVEAFDEETGEFINNEDLIMDLANELKDKRDDLVDFLADKKTEAKGYEKMLQDEIVRLQGRKKSFVTQQASLNNTIDFVLEGEKTKTLHHTFYYQKTESVAILDETKIAPEYIDFKPSYNKTALKKALKAGEEITGVELTETIGLRIK